MTGQALINIRSRQWQVSIVNQYWELIQGLAGLTYIPSGTGMLFDLGQQQIITVTTMDMLFSIDIALLSDSLIITELYHNVEPGCLVTSEHPARYFLEVNAGELEGLDVGDRASLQILTTEQTEVPDWLSPIISLATSMMILTLAVGIVRCLISSDEEKLLPQTVRKQTPAAQLLEKWSKAKVRNTTLALKDIEELHARYGYDIDDCRDALMEYKDIVREDYADYEEYQEEKNEAWQKFLECLEELAAEEEQLQARTEAKYPAKQSQLKPDELEFLPDSPEFLAYTIDDIGYRDKIDRAFQEAIERARRQR